MENRAQTIVHLNSHGSRSQVQTFDTANNSFSNISNMPINDINKVGLMYVSIPRTWDCLHAGNNKCELTLYTNLGNRIPLEFNLPLVNYYDPTQFIIDENVEVDHQGITTIPDKDSGRSENGVCFTELLSNVINKSIDNTRLALQHNGGPPPVDQTDDLLRYYFLDIMRCMVTTDNRGRLAFNFGQADIAGEADPGSVLADVAMNWGSQVSRIEFRTTPRVRKMLGLPLTEEEWTRMSGK